MSYREKTRDRYNELKAECIERLGGRCVHCGYSEFVAGLSFHHTGDKRDNVGRFLTRASMSWESDETASVADLYDEVDKCVLLCFNCHMGLHAGEWSYEGGS